MRLNIPATLVAAVLLAPCQALAAVTVTIANGTVSVSAQDATVRQILTEWARVGQTRIVNIERVSGPPISIELTNVPEAQALDTLLRAVSGYLAAPRASVVANASAYDRIFILPTSTGTPPRPGPAAAPGAQAFAPPPFQPPPQDDQNSDDEPQQRPSPPVPQNPPRGPAFNTFPRSPAQPPQQQPAAPPQDVQPNGFPAPTAPAGVSTPGMVVPSPQQPGQPPTPGSVR
jgi:hypothetical protein